METYVAKPAEMQRKWYIIDAAGKPLGRVASKVASVLRGKHKPTYTPYMDNGDHVIVINAEKVVLTGKKLDQKRHYWHTNHPGGLKSINYRAFLAKSPERVMELAVRGMIPHNRLGRKLFTKLKVYRGADHPHAAQQPEKLEL